MSTQLKCIIPLIDSTLNLKDISEETGFVDAYIYDQNRPALEQCCFLMYDAKTRTIESMKRAMKLKKMPLLRSIKHVASGKRMYIVYTFQFFDPVSRYIFKGRIPKDEYAMRITKFWNGTEDDVNECLTSSTKHSIPIDTSSVPEENYIPTIQDYREYRRKKRVVVTK